MTFQSQTFQQHYTTSISYIGLAGCHWQWELLALKSNEERFNYLIIDWSTQNIVIPLLFCSVVGLFVAGSTVGENPEEPNHVWILSGAWCVRHKRSFPAGNYQYLKLLCQINVKKVLILVSINVSHLDKVGLVLPVEKIPKM